MTQDEDRHRDSTAKTRDTGTPGDSKQFQRQQKTCPSSPSLGKDETETGRGWQGPVRAGRAQSLAQRPCNAALRVEPESQSCREGGRQHVKTPPTGLPAKFKVSGAWAVTFRV